MATKVEQDNRIKELEAQLAGLDPKALADRDERIKSLESEVDAAREANDRLNGQLRAAEDALEPAKRERDALKQAMAEVSAGSSAQARELETVKSLSKSLQADVDSLEGKLTLASAGSKMEGDYAVIDGRAFRVEKRYLAKWLHQDVQRRFIEEDTTVVVLDRKGE